MRTARHIRRLSLVVVLLLGSSAAQVQALQSFAEVQRAFPSSEANLLDRKGELLQQIRLNPHERRLSWVSLEDISPALRNALIASEDKRFYQHSGVDWSAVAAAAWGNLWSTKTRGASTITMQLAGLLDDDLRRRNAPRSMTQKMSQVVVAQWLEQRWRKDQILEAYLNLVSFRGELVGLHALSRVLFDKHPSGLNQREAAIAVALIRGPNATPVRVAQRACRILTDQNAAQECKGLEGFTLLALARTGSNSEVIVTTTAPQLAPHLARKLLKTPGLTVRSTLDAGVQRFANAALRRQLASLVERNIEDGAIIAIDNASGDVLAWVGSSGSFSNAADVDGVVALRQAGSTLKPFLYELAIEKKWMTAASILNDAAINLPTASGLYIPQNYDKQFKGLVSLRTALGSSLNIPAVRTLVTVTPTTFFGRLQNLGFQLRESGDFYGYSLALGSADVSLLALTNAYRALANQGQYSGVRTALSDPPIKMRNVMMPGAAFIIGDILADRSARARTFGLESALSTRVWAAVKTGTSKDMRDNWAVGYSDRYTVGVWVGNASGLPMWDVSGVTGAAPIWQEVMEYLHARQQTRQHIPQMPAGVVEQDIRYQDKIEAPRKEYFLVGTEQSLITTAKSDDISIAIRYPTPGMLVALDPDIPPDRQRLRFAADGLSKGYWRLDGKLLALPKCIENTSKKGCKSSVLPASQLAFDWMPWPGRHTLELLDSNHAVVDQVKFEVRGAVEKAPEQLRHASDKKIIYPSKNQPS
ncbi:penicillin-binding protein 1C [Glaciimonas sp. PCH181]|uniref:penicillin-binding protein 1C n=1 Tax=Glaciimonas sp. PCH181 TaxID=2133943 RepID=UPI000D350529|nr:penicillin-binding protein 1C [Glaciimonas sp. PCH181]PUA18569.1 penicillin-binding protein 1C [Glaciimonas sp. PCH181]